MMKNIEETPIRSLNVDYQTLDVSSLNETNTPSGKKAVGANEFLRKKSLHLGFTKSERLASLDTKPVATYRKDRMVVQRRYRTFNPSMNTFSFQADGAKTELQTGFELYKGKPSTRRLHRYYYNFGVRPSKRQEIDTLAGRIRTLAQDALDKITGTQDLSLLMKNDPYMEFPNIVHDMYRKPSDELLTDKLRTTKVETNLTEKLNDFVTTAKNVMGPKIIEAQQVAEDLRERVGATVNRLIDTERREFAN